MTSQALFNHAARVRSEGSTTSGRKSVLMLLCAIAAVLAAMVVLPAGASAFNVANFTYTNSTNQANGHPNTSVSFNRQGSDGEDLRDIQLDLPAGVFANPEAASPKCTSAQFNADSCPASSRVGGATVVVKAMGLLDMTIPGEVDVLTADTGQVATLGISLRPDKLCILFVFCAVPNKIFMKTGISINTFDDSNLRTYTPGSPKSSVIGIPLLFVTPTITGDITVNSMKLDFQSRGGTAVKTCNWLGFNCKTTPPSGPYFFRNPNVCDQPSVARVNLVSYQNANSAASTSFTASGCSAVPSASTTFTYTPTVRKYRAASGTQFILNVPEADATIQHALPKIVDNDFPLGSGINLDALAGVDSCTENQLRAKACPAGSIVGSAVALSKYLPAGLKGNVYATGSVGNQLPLAVLLRGQAQGSNDQTYVIFRGTLGVRGTNEGGDGRAYARFDRIPQLPFSKFTLNLDAPVYVNPDRCGTSTTAATITQFSGQVVNKTSSYENTDCPAAPQTTITQEPASTTVDPTFDFAYASSIPGSTFTCTLAKRTDPNTPATGPSFPCNGDGWTAGGTTGSFVSENMPNGKYDFTVYSTNQTVADPTPATTTFTLNLSNVFTIDPFISPSSVQAASHPDFTVGADIDGGQPASLRIKLPKGFNGSLAVVAQCDKDVALAGNCTDDSKIGTAEMTSNVGPGTENSTSGTIYLTSRPTTDDAGGIAVKIESPSGTFIAIASAYLVNNGNNQYIDIRSFPNKLTAPGGAQIDFTIKRLAFNFIGSNGFLTMPSQCGTDQFTSSGNAYDGSIAAVETETLTTTGCGSILSMFTPDMLQTFSSTQAGTTSNDDAFIAGFQDLGGSVKNVSVLEPAAFGPNFASFGEADDMCPGGSVTGADQTFDPASCPASAIIGSMTLYTPLLTEPLTGTVYLINQLPLPWFGVVIDEPGIHVRITGFTDLIKTNPSCQEQLPGGQIGYCQKQIQVKFVNLPDVPMQAVDMALTNDPRWNRAHTKMLNSDVLQVADPNTANCPEAPNNTDVAKATVESYTGAVVNLEQLIEFTGC